MLYIAECSPSAGERFLREGGLSARERNPDAPPLNWVLWVLSYPAIRKYHPGPQGGQLIRAKDGLFSVGHWVPLDRQGRWLVRAQLVCIRDRPNPLGIGRPVANACLQTLAWGTH